MGGLGLPELHSGGGDGMVKRLGGQDGPMQNGEYLLPSITHLHLWCEQ